ncbi:haloacid dehalogenase type II [Mycobacterium sp. 3519A]|uniref:haloacid dehalogenase type II n=1 Tax=Mycobacterium sp. 3519A TaxID=2057184 RepID=UPI003511463C
MLVFDVNETLLDLGSLGPLFERLFGDASVLHTWFDKLVLHSMTLTLSGYYADFFTLGRAVLQLLASSRNVSLAHDDPDLLEQAMRTMPAHPDVEAGLEQLRSEGYRLITLTNSPHRPDTASPLDNAGLSDYFEKQFTVDSTKLFKPSTHLYRRVAAEVGVEVSDCMMIAAHTWDIIGAQGAGMQGALITRRGTAPIVAAGIPVADLIAENIPELAGELIRRKR